MREREMDEQDPTSSESLDMTIDVPICHQRFLKSKIKHIFSFSEICSRIFRPQRISPPPMGDYQGGDRDATGPVGGDGHRVRKVALFPLSRRLHELPLHLHFTAHLAHGGPSRSAQQVRHSRLSTRIRPAKQIGNNTKRLFFFLLKFVAGNLN